MNYRKWFFSDLFDFNPIYAVVAIFVFFSAVGVALFTFLAMAPPKEINLLSGPEGGMFHQKALEYQKILEQQKIKVNVLTSKGSVENLDRITDSKGNIDFTFIQSGLIDPIGDKAHDYSHLVSLGAIAQLPMLLFYSGSEIQQIKQLEGKRVIIGNQGSGTQKMAIDILELNGILDKVIKIEMGGLKALEQLSAKKVDAVFMMGEKIGLSELKIWLSSSNFRIFNFKNQSKAYTRKLEYLGTIDLPEGIIDLGQNIPKTDLVLLGPTIELITTDRLHPAISDLILDAAQQIHFKPHIFQKRGAFPNQHAHVLPLSQDAQRFYQSGRNLLYRNLPFGLASLVSRFLFVVLPLLFVVVPAIQALPFLIRWKNQLRIRRLYNRLMKLEKEYRLETARTEIDRLHLEFAKIDDEIKTLKVKPAYAEQFYHLRRHIDYVRKLMDFSNTSRG